MVFFVSTCGGWVVDRMKPAAAFCQTPSFQQRRLPNSMGLEELTEAGHWKVPCNIRQTENKISPKGPINTANIGVSCFLYCFGLLNTTYGFLTISRVLEGLRSFGGLVGIISTYPGTSPTSWCRCVMIANGCSLVILQQIAYAFLCFPRVLEGLRSSWDLLGCISTYPGTSPAQWCHVMAVSHGSCFDRSTVT